MLMDLLRSRVGLRHSSVQYHSNQEWKYSWARQELNEQKIMRVVVRKATEVTKKFRDYTQEEERERCQDGDSGFFPAYQSNIDR